MSESASSEFHPSALDAVNEALVSIGEGYQLTVLSKTAGRDVPNAANSRAAAYVYESALDAILTAHPWTFLMTRKRVTATPDANMWRVKRPSDALTIVGFENEIGDRLEYISEGDDLRLYDMPRAIIYLRQEDDLAVFPRRIRSLLVKRLAFDLANPNSGSKDELKVQYELYTQLLNEAKVWDTRQNKTNRKRVRNHIADVVRGDAPIDGEDWD